MPRRKQGGPVTCPRCGAEVGEPVKTWQLVSPFPDKKGRITITIMGVYQCPRCGYRWRAVVSKLKVGGGGVEVGEKRIEEEEEERPAKVIEIDLDELDEELLEEE